MREFDGFRDGEVYHMAVPTPLGDIAFEGDLTLQGNCVRLRNVSIEPLGTKYLPVGTGAMLRLLRILLTKASEHGYTYLEIEGVRTSGANPHRPVHFRRRA